MKDEIINLNKDIEYIKETIEELQELEDIDYDDEYEEVEEHYNDEYYIMDINKEV